MDDMSPDRVHPRSFLAMHSYQQPVGFDSNRKMLQFHSKHLRGRWPEHFRGSRHHRPPGLRIEGSQFDPEEENRFRFCLCSRILVSAPRFTRQISCKN